jgi:hypothetical protein
MLREQESFLRLGADDRPDQAHRGARHGAAADADGVLVAYKDAASSSETTFSRRLLSRAAKSFRNLL